MKKVGYARVSSQEQNLDRQIQLLSQYVESDMIITDKASGKDLNRSGYQSLKVGIGKLVKGDELYITSIDRLSRNKEHAKNELKYYSDKGIRVKILDIPTTLIDLPQGQEWVFDMINNILIEVLASIAENERQKIKERQRQGYNAMKRNENGKLVSNRTHKQVGRPTAEYPTNWKEVYTQWQDKIITAVKAMELLNLKRTTFYKLVKQYENN